MTSIIKLLNENSKLECNVCNIPSFWSKNKKLANPSIYLLPKTERSKR